MVACGVGCRNHLLWQFGRIFNISQNGTIGEHGRSISESKAWIHVEHSIEYLPRVLSQSESTTH